MTEKKDPLPRYAGPLTYARAPYADIASLRPGMVAVAGATYDLSGTGAAGCRYGPREIRICSVRLASICDLDGDQVLDGNRTPFSHAGKRLAGKLVDVGDINEYSTDWPKTASALEDAMYQIARRGVMPVIFGGDQFNSYPLVLGYARAMADQPKKVGYIRFSSRLDLGEKDPLWGEAWRGSTVRRILDSQAIGAQNMVWVGVNGYLPQTEVALVKDRALRIFTTAQLRRDGIEKTVGQALQIAGDGCDTIYASIDLDLLDGAHVHATNLPSFDGLKNFELDQVIDLLAKGKVGALDITGCNPMVEYRAHGRLAAQQTAWWAFRFMMRSDLTN